MYYNYKYDQINRITGMDAYTKYLAAAQAWPSYIVSLDDYRERVSYDANGNILKYSRNGTTLGSRPLDMDKLTYNYYAGTNQLRQVRDSVNAANYSEDIDDQLDTSNFRYDAIGNLVKDSAEGIKNIDWNIYGKITRIYKANDTITYTYDAGGNRISKKVKHGSTDSMYTWYARDASGNVLSVYRIKNDTAYQDELHLYGSSRIGMIRPGRNLILDAQYGDTSGTFISGKTWKGNVYRRGQKFFELANHLGNVLVTISDKKLGIDGNTDGAADYYMPDVVTANDYYPFGMGMPERKFSATGNYRYGFNGKENDNEVKGEGNQQDYGMRIYDPRLGRFLSVDPITGQYPELTPYQFASNRPIDGIDQDGLEFWRAPMLAAAMSQRKAAQEKAYVQQIAKNLQGASSQAHNKAIFDTKNKAESVCIGCDLQKRMTANGTVRWGEGVAVNRSQFAETWDALTKVHDDVLYPTAVWINQNLNPLAKGVEVATGKSIESNFTEDKPRTQSFQEAAIWLIPSLKMETVALGTVERWTVGAVERQVANGSAKAGGEGALVNLTEETFSQALFKGAENVGGYTIYGTKGLVGNTFNRNIFLLEASGSKSLSGLKSFMQSLEAEALRSGANKISIYGSSVINKGFLNPNIAQRFGYTFEQSGNGVILQKVLK